MREFVEHVALQLAEHPDHVRVTELRGRRTLIVELRCHPEDLGRIIGRDGKTIGAVRTLVSNLAAKERLKAIVEIVD